MLTRLIDFSLRHALLVILATVGLALLGVASLFHLPIDAFPDTTPVQVQINTPAPALGPLEVEQQVTRPVEQAVSGAPRVCEVRSISRFGISQVTLLFEDGVDVYRARQILAERLAAARLPAGLGPATLGPISSGLGEVFQYRMVGEGYTLEELRTLHEWLVRPQLRSVSGIAEINTWGGQERQYQVRVDPERLLRHGLSLDDLVQALERNNRNVGGGVLASTGEARLVQGVSVLDGLPAIDDVVLAAVQGVPVRVRDVATVATGAALRHGAVTAEGEGETVLGLAFMLMGENSHAVTQRVKARVAEVERTLPRGVRLVPMYDRTHLVDMVLHTVRDNLALGALLVVAVLFFFLGNVRAGLIVALAVPLSFLFATTLMRRCGVSASLMSLGAVDFGLIVDSSVILVENAVRRLRADTSGRPVREIVREAAVEVRRPTLFGELIIMIVYLPILTLEGIEGKLFRPMALTVLFALIGSMLFSLTLMPVLTALFLERRRAPRPGAPAPPPAERETWPVRAALAVYRPVLRLALAHRRVTLAAAALLLLVGAGVATRLGSEFVPRLSEMAITINTVRATGVSLEESVRYGTRVEQLLKREFPDEIEHIWSRTGTAEVATDLMGVEVSDVFLTLKPRRGWTHARTQAELVDRMGHALEGLPGMRSVFTQPIEMRINEMLAGTRSDVVLKLYGDDLDSLRVHAAALADAVALVPGAADVVVDQVTGLPMLEYRVRRDALARHGLAAEMPLRLVEARTGIPAGEVRDGQRRFPLVVRLPEELADDPAGLARVALPRPGGGTVPFGDLVEAREYDGPSTVTREWGRRRVAVQINVRGRDIGSFVAAAQRAAAAVPLPPGYALGWGGQFTHLIEARQRLLVIVPTALLLVLVLLYITYGRWRDALRVFTGVPFAAVGGVLALALRGLPFSVSAGVGFVALSGVAVLGDMVLVSFIRQRRAAGDTPEAAVHAAAETRLRPVLMTALVAACGFLPMALNTGVGAEVQRPLATVVIGGLVSSTLLTLVVLPVLYLVFARRKL